MRKKTETKRLRNLAKEVLDSLGYKRSFIEVNLVTKGVMRSLNYKFKGKDSATNVLSFGVPRGFPDPNKNLLRSLGEVYLDPSYIKSRGENIDYLLIHGLLHLLGFGHERYDDRMKMMKLERKILKWQKIKF
ncbi:MAG: Endoribonuclease YbeY [candidate division WS2 bacterium]|nr:Endoribonuclease YbeY [Candidatus Psychracetigena formicireducens]